MTAVESERATDPADTVIDHREVVSTLRSAVLHLDAADIDVHPRSIDSSVWGVVIETAYPDAVATLVVLADGSVSVYVSDGTGCVGCGANTEVHEAAGALLEVAEESVDFAMPTDDTDYPTPGCVRIFFLCTDGRRSVEVRLETLSSIAERLNALYFAGQRVINAVERSAAGQSIEQEIRLAQLTRPEPTRGAASCLSVGSAVHRLRR